MEDDDFGFTRRKENVLRKVLEDRECEGCTESTRDEEENKNSGEESSRRAGARSTGIEASVDEVGAVVPDETEGVSIGREPDENSASNGSPASADVGQSRPETGNEEAKERSGRTAEASVGSRTPNIPNVVEYHLKVNPQSRDIGRDKSKEYGAEPRANKHHDRSGEGGSSESETMKSESMTPLSSRSEKKSLSSKLSTLSIDKNVFEGSTELPQVFQVKYLGSHDARGLWGIKHTRKPVDNMVASAKSLPPDTILPLVKLVVSRDGVSLFPLGKRKFDSGLSRIYPIESISYGVQDLVYTRVFSMIVVRDNANSRRVSPFECHAFVCESKHHARQLTYGLATAFQIYSRNVKSLDRASEMSDNAKKRFAIDLRSPDEIETDLNIDSEA